jgi:formate hydrogenlyase subunit 6/NADH:ubiquinone oxidoreductase subunit I
MGLSIIGVTKMAKKRSISPIFKRAASHIFTKPATAKYPFVKPHLPDDARGEPMYEIKACNIIDIGAGNPVGLNIDVRSIVGSSCRVCARDCPTGAIQIVEVEGKGRPQINLNKCIFCHQCVETCPRHAIKASDLYELATTDKSCLIMKPNVQTETKEKPK